MLANYTIVRTFVTPLFTDGKPWKNPEKSGKFRFWTWKVRKKRENYGVTSSTIGMISNMFSYFNNMFFFKSNWEFWIKITKKLYYWLNNIEKIIDIIPMKLMVQNMT